MNNKESLVNYLNQSVNMALPSSAQVMQDENTYNNSFSIDVDDGGVIFIPRLPAGYIIDNNLYQTIFKIINTALYPRYTVLKQNNMYLIPMDTSNIHIQRALYFPWKKGVSKRLVIPDLKLFAKNNSNPNIIQIMEGFSVNYNKVTSIAIAGNSGSGKSYNLTYWLELLNNISTIVVIDPKMDEPSRWARNNKIKYICPTEDSSKSDYLNQVNNVLSKALEHIHNRQHQKFENPKATFKHITIVIDELLALTEGVNKAIKNTFFSLISQVALLGRTTRVHLLLASQRFDHESVPTSVREQMNVLLQLGNINRKTTQFLFPDLDPDGIVIPTGKGTGIIQVIDDEHPYQVLPLLCPTYYSKEQLL